LNPRAFDQGDGKARRLRDQTADRLLVEMLRLDAAYGSRRPTVAMVAEHIGGADEVAALPRRQHQLAPLRPGIRALDHAAKNDMDAVTDFALTQQIFAILVEHDLAGRHHQIEVRLLQGFQ
jgi:hypothetical protein